MYVILSFTPGILPFRDPRVEGRNNNKGSYSACTIWGHYRNKYYLIYAWRGRVEFPTLKGMVFSLIEKYPLNALLIEDRASGQSLIQELKRDTTLPIIPIKAVTDKVTRAHGVTPLFDSGLVVLPKDPWAQPFVSELLEFPKGANDDFTDSAVQALDYLAHRKVARPTVGRSIRPFSIYGR